MTLHSVRDYPSKEDLFQACYLAAPQSGMVCEFGVRDGGSLKQIINIFGPGVIGFDSFKGLSEGWLKAHNTGVPAGWFATDKPEIEGAEIVEGWFEDTLPGFFKESLEPLRFVHIDCDIYSATVTVLEAIKPHLVPGSIIQFDELCQFEDSNYSFWEQGEWRALQESGIEWAPIGRTRHEQVAIRIV